MPGDRFVLRRPSPQDTLGGGEIVDPWAPRLRRKDGDVWAAELARLGRGDRVVWLERAAEEGIGVDVWARRAEAPAASSSGIACSRRASWAGSRARSSRPWSAFIERVRSKSARTAASSGAIASGISPTACSTRWSIASPQTGALRVEGPLVRAGGFGIALTSDQAALQARIRATIEAAGADGTKPKELFEKHPEPETQAIVHLLERAGAVEQVANLGWVSRAALDDLSSRVRGWFRQREDLSPGDFKELTGLSRKGAIPLLEWLDKSRLTRRAGDVRHAEVPRSPDVTNRDRPGWMERGPARVCVLEGPMPSPHRYVVEGPIPVGPRPRP